MSRGRPVETIVLSEEEKTELLSLSTSRALPHGLVRRAQIIHSKRAGEAKTDF